MAVAYADVRLVGHHARMDPIAEQAHAAIVATDWDAVRLLLHPYLHWTTTDGSTIRGRQNVLAMLKQYPVPPPKPTSTELRDGQIYRWRS